MKMPRADLTADQVRACLDYDPETGVLTWARSRKGCGGRAAGTLGSKGYISISFGDVPYRAHRLAWLHYYGEWPILALDHINRNTSDNRICNLREASETQNNANSVSRNSLGIKGVYPLPSGSWRACIKAGGKFKHLGTFKSVEAAKEAYALAAVTAFGEFARFAA